MIVARGLGIKSAHFMSADTLRKRIDEKNGLADCDRESLRKIADELGLDVAKNAGAEVLRKRIEEAMADAGNGE
jgi:predicted hydrolase (HD superfamily)